MLGYFRSVTINKKRIYNASFVETMLVLSVFTKEIATRRIFGIDFDFIAYTFAIFFFFFNVRRIFFSDTIPWKIYIYLIITSLFSILFLQLGYGGFFKQLFPILIIFSTNFFICSKFDWRNLFMLYVKYAFLSAVFGILQVILSFGGVKLLMQQAGRLDSVAYEPSHYAAILVPALVFTFFHFKRYRIYFMVMALALFLTLNLTGYLAFMLAISIAFINPFYLMVSLPVLYYLTFYILPGFSENFSMRIADTQAVFRGDVNVLSRDVNANGTTVSLYSNLVVAEENLKNGNVFGSGLGGHEEMYHRHYKYTPFRYSWFYGLNAPSGHSLTIRVFSELGLVGLVLYIITLARSVILLDKGIYRSISLACLSHFICKSFKLGGIIDYGTPFFFAILLINFMRYKQNKKKLKEQNNERRAEKAKIPVPVLQAT